MIQPTTLYDAYCLALLQEKMNVLANNSEVCDPCIGLEYSKCVDGLVETYTEEIQVSVKNSLEENSSLDVYEVIIGEGAVPCLIEVSYNRGVETSNICHVAEPFKLGLCPVVEIETRDKSEGFQNVKLLFTDKASFTPMESVKIDMKQIAAPSLPFLAKVENIEHIEATRHVYSSNYGNVKTGNSEVIVIIKARNYSTLLDYDPYWTTTVASSSSVQLWLIRTTLTFSSTCNLDKLLLTSIHDPSNQKH